MGFDADWRVTNVEFIPKAKLVDIRIEYCGSELSCPECKGSCPRADMAPKRTWRHLDTMQFTTTIHASVPRSQCSTCGVLTQPVPWATMLKRHLSGLLSYVTHRIANAASEGFNSKIQSIKSAAGGFSSFENYRTRILFFCGKLDLFPSISTH